MSLYFRCLLAVYSMAFEAVAWLVLLPIQGIGVLSGRSTLRELRDRMFGAVRPPGARVLVHAVSAGEMIAAEPLVARLAPRKVLLSTQTKAGLASAELLQKTHAHVEGCVVLPWDRFVVGRWLRKIDVSAVIVLETEIWPNVFAACRRIGIPLFIANGRIRDRDVQRYCLAQPFFRGVLECATWIGVQNERAKSAFIEIGAPDHLVQVNGNLKLDAAVVLREFPIRLRASLAQGPLIVAGSTHDPEERVLLNCVHALRRNRPVRLVVAPRRTQRAGDVARMAERLSLRATCLSRLLESPQDEEPWDVLVVDVYGWLTGFYDRADVVFVGGTLARIGGHNVVEPAALGRPVIVGPHVSEIEEIVHTLVNEGGIIKLPDKDSEAALLATLDGLLSDPVRARAIGAAAREVCRASAGAADRCWSGIGARMPMPSGLRT